MVLRPQVELAAIVSEVENPTNNLTVSLTTARFGARGGGKVPPPIIGEDTIAICGGATGP
jgi:hypothetical protein